jgi:signal transduction histidine kinase
MILLTSGAFFVMILFLLLFVFKSLENQRNKQILHKFEVIQLKSENLERLISKTEDEKYRISKDLHDEIGPLLSILKINATSEGREHEIIDKISMKIKEVCFDLAPALLLNFGFEAALDYFQVHQKNIKFKFEDFDKLDNSKLSDSEKTNLFRIISELVNNIIKHGKSKLVNIVIHENMNNLKIHIYYEGIGMTNEIFSDKKLNNKSIGLISITERLMLLNAIISFEKKESICEICIQLENYGKL